MASGTTALVGSEKKYELDGMPVESVHPLLGIPTRTIGNSIYFEETF
jgi:hypothetical protein